MKRLTLSRFLLRFIIKTVVVLQYYACQGPPNLAMRERLIWKYAQLARYLK